LNDKTKKEISELTIKTIKEENVDVVILDFRLHKDDFECKKGEETRFVEVKSSVTKNYSFNISTNEVKIGHSKEKSFDILLITNLLSEDINFKYLNFDKTF
jgi:hypothetical protein